MFRPFETLSKDWLVGFVKGIVFDTLTDEEYREMLDFFRQKAPEIAFRPSMIRNCVLEEAAIRFTEYAKYEQAIKSKKPGPMLDDVGLSETLALLHTLVCMQGIESNFDLVRREFDLLEKKVNSIK